MAHSSNALELSVLFAGKYASDRLVSDFLFYLLPLENGKSDSIEVVFGNE